MSAIDRSQHAFVAAQQMLQVTRSTDIVEQHARFSAVFDAVADELGAAHRHLDAAVSQIHIRGRGKLANAVVPRVEWSFRVHDFGEVKAGIGAARDHARRAVESLPSLDDPRTGMLLRDTWQAADQLPTLHRTANGLASRLEKLDKALTNVDALGAFRGRVRSRMSEGVWDLYPASSSREDALRTAMVDPYSLSFRTSFEARVDGTLRSDDGLAQAVAPDMHIAVAYPAYRNGSDPKRLTKYVLHPSGLGSLHATVGHLPTGLEVARDAAALVARDAIQLREQLDSHLPRLLDPATFERQAAADVARAIVAAHSPAPAARGRSVDALLPISRTARSNDLPSIDADRLLVESVDYSIMRDRIRSHLSAAVDRVLSARGQIVSSLVVPDRRVQHYGFLAPHAVRTITQPRMAALDFARALEETREARRIVAEWLETVDDQHPAFAEHHLLASRLDTTADELRTVAADTLDIADSHPSGVSLVAVPGAVYQLHRDPGKLDPLQLRFVDASAIPVIDSWNIASVRKNRHTEVLVEESAALRRVLAPNHNEDVEAPTRYDAVGQDLGRYLDEMMK